MCARAIVIVLVASVTSIILGCGASTPEAQIAEVRSTPTAALRIQPPRPAATVSADSTPIVQALPKVKTGYSVGDHVSEFEMSLIGGGKVTSADLLSEGRPVFLFFLATW